MIKRIAITGPESTGKSMLAEQLAQHYRSVWVKEYAREYLDRLKKPYEEGDILKIAKGQLRLQEEGALSLRNREEGRPFLFCDTELLVTKIWSEVKFGRCDPWILKQLESQPVDLYLLCYIDTPWEEDPQREHPHMREQLFTAYYDEMNERGWNFKVISGLGEERLKNAIKFINDCFTVKSDA